MQFNFIKLSLFVNIIVLIPVCIALMKFGESKFIVDAWGEPSSSRSILLSIYISILLLSCILLFAYIQDIQSVSIKYMISSLLIVQVVYKLITPFTVGITNPVVISNLLISALHIVTLKS
jgi:phosphoglycerol transferase MdoB-like AlkP superfamily enzyme